MIHIVKQQLHAPVRVFVNGINRQILSLITFLFSSECLDRFDLQGFKVQKFGIPKEQDCVTKIKHLLCSKSPNTLCYGTKCKTLSKICANSCSKYS